MTCRGIRAAGSGPEAGPAPRVGPTTLLLLAATALYVASLPWLTTTGA